MGAIAAQLSVGNLDDEAALRAFTYGAVNYKGDLSSAIADAVANVSKQADTVFGRHGAEKRTFQLVIEHRA